MERVEEEEERAAGGTDTRTEAQMSFDKVLDKRVGSLETTVVIYATHSALVARLKHSCFISHQQKERILKKAKKTHKQRVEVGMHTASRVNPV